MSAYYNEHEPYAVEWLRNLIRQGLIADGEVDGRSIVDVRPDDLRGFTQCHFFAGIGVWSHALRLAGWRDDRPVWTGSCPCQPFSDAGKGKGFDDARHLWPEFHRLIAECCPPVVFGEQVASKNGLGWLDTVSADMEASGYAVGASDLCAAGVGSPHIRQRLWFVGERLGNADSPRHEGHGLQSVLGSGEGRGPLGSPAGSGATVGLAVAGGARSPEQRGQPGEREQALGSGLAKDGTARRLGNSGGQGSPLCQCEDLRGEGRRGEGRAAEQPGGSPRGLDHTLGNGRGEGWHGGHAGDERQQPHTDGCNGGLAVAELHEQRQGRRPAGEGATGNEPRLEPRGRGTVGELANAQRPGPTNGQWRAADWLHCRDGKWRPVESGTFPLAHGAPARVGRLRAYGNAIVPQVAAQVIGAYMDIAEGLA